MLTTRHGPDYRALSLATLIAACASVGASGLAWAQGAHGGAPGAGQAPQSAPDTLSPAQRAARRFPQPVRVGDLRDRQVLEPSNHQGVLGRVEGIARSADGSLLLLMRYGGLLGYGTRLIAVPIEATALLGQFVQVVDIPEERLKALPTFDGKGGTPLGPDEVIRVGINRN